MRRLALAVAATLATVSTPALATKPVSNTNAPTLHGFCSLGNVCVDGGNNTPTAVNPPAFGFSAGGHAESGILLLDILVPNVVQPGAFTLTSFTSGGFLGNSTYTANLVNSVTPWSTGNLQAYLGLSATPANPIGNYLPVAQGYQPGATGFWVYQTTIGTALNPITLPSNSGAADSFLMQLGQNLLQGSFILGYLDQNGSYGATANSGAILETGAPPPPPPPPPPVPEPTTWAMMLAGFGVTGFAMRRNRRKALLTQIA